jgi:hypothetical protein
MGGDRAAKRGVVVRLHIHPMPSGGRSDTDEPMRRLARWEDLPATSHPLVDAMVEKRFHSAVSDFPIGRVKGVFDVTT